MTAPDTTATRAGDREREKTASDLGLALAQGYLDMTDYEQRVQSAFGAGTRDELRALTADLPVANLRRNDPRRRDAHARAARRSAAVHLAAYIVGVAADAGHLARRRPDRRRMVLLAGLADHGLGHRSGQPHPVGQVRIALRDDAPLAAPAPPPPGRRPATGAVCRRARGAG